MTSTDRELTRDRALCWLEPGDILDELAERSGLLLEHMVTDRASAHDYLAFPREPGVAEAGAVWQVGDDRVLVGMR